MDIDWSKLNSLQIGKFAEAFAKAAFQAHDFSTYSADVDDRGIDFLAEKNGIVYNVQVKSLVKGDYVFMQKCFFKPTENTLLCLICFASAPNSIPQLYIIPSKEWNDPDELLVSHDYGAEMKSKPEWGVRVSKKNRPLLEKYTPDAFFDTVE